MKLLILLLMMVPAFTQAAYAPKNCALEIFGRCLSKAVVEDDSFKILHGYTTTSSNTNVHENFDAAGYVVPADTQFRIIGFILDHETASGNLYYTDDDIGERTATVGTNPVYFMADGTVGEAGVSRSGGVTFFIMNAVIPTGKYISWNGTGAANHTITVVGIEESTL